VAGGYRNMSDVADSLRNGLAQTVRIDMSCDKRLDQRGELTAGFLADQSPDLWVTVYERHSPLP
jgi:hypothetical protein